MPLLWIPLREMVRCYLQRGFGRSFSTTTAVRPMAAVVWTALRT